MDAVAWFFTQNLVYVFFFYGLAFFSLGLVVLLESGRASEFRFARALRPLAWFGLVHGLHEWLEMFLIFAAGQRGYVPGPAVEVLRLGMLIASFVLLLSFGTRLLPGAENNPKASRLQVLAMMLLWLLAVAIVAWRFRPDLAHLFVAADVLARYALALPGSLLAAWALLRERHDFHARGMSQYGGSLLWAGLAFAVYGVIGQIFVKSSLIYPSQTINSTLFIRTFGFPIQLLRALAAAGLTLHLGKALRAFEAESRLRLARANKARIEAQAAALAEQQRRVYDVETLNTALQVTANELASLVDMSRILSSALNLEQIAGAALKHVVHSFERACCAVVFLRRPDGGYELLRAYRRPQAPMPAVPPPVTELSVRAADASTSAGASLDGQVVVLRPDSFDGGKAYRSLGVPLFAKGQTFGALTLSSVREEEPLGEDELRLLTAFAQQFAAAIDNVRLHQVVQERETQLEELVRKLVHAQEDERQRIARELHDETGQKLTALGMGLAALEVTLSTGDSLRTSHLLRSLREMNDQAITELRNIMANLRPAQLDDLGLAAALRWYVSQYQTRYPDTHVQLKIEKQPGRLPPEHEIILFRVVQEALTNVERHAHATQVTLNLTRTPSSVRVEIVDNGAGFDSKQPPRHEPGSGLGLPGMRERVALVNGQLEIDSAPGKGTRILVDLPLPEMPARSEAAPIVEGRK